MSKNCGKCRWLKEYHTSPNGSVKNYKCVLSQCIFSTNQACDCPWYDKDLDDEMICFNCQPPPTWILTNPEVGACRNTSSVDKP